MSSMSNGLHCYFSQHLYLCLAFSINVAKEQLLHFVFVGVEKHVITNARG